MSGRVNVVARLSRKTYLILEQVADSRGCQIHHLLEELADQTASAAREYVSSVPPRRSAGPDQTQVEQFLRLHADGLTDHEIAIAMNAPYSTVGAWRRTHGLSPNPSQRSGDAARRRLHAEGLTDRQIAEKIGMGRAAISVWRRKNGLPINSARARADKAAA